MREECGERGSLDFRIRVLRSLVLGVAVPARTGKQRNRIWSQNEICGCDSFLCRTLWPFRWARKPTHQSGGSSVRRSGDRSTGSGVRSVPSPENFTTLAHFSVSSATSFPKSAGEPGINEALSSANRAFVLGPARIALISLLSLSMISAGVPLGTPTPYHA